MRHCLVCGADIDNDSFGEHVDGHSDAELARWPGGLEALELELQKSLAESFGRSMKEGMGR